MKRKQVQHANCDEVRQDTHKQEKQIFTSSQDRLSNRDMAMKRVECFYTVVYSYTCKWMDVTVTHPLAPGLGLDANAAKHILEA